MRFIAFAVFSVLLSTGAIGCTAITDFENPPEFKIDIKEEVGDTIAVQLDGQTGAVSLSFESDLPVEAADELYTMIGEEILLTVVNEESYANAPLTESPVAVAPESPGEYQVVVADNRVDVTITFYNETLAGQMMRVGGNYAALLTVAENDWFETGDFDFDVTVE